MAGHRAPVVTVAVPLFASRPFLPVITENLRRLDHPDAEIIVSDRHLADDALESLRGLFGADPRVRFIEATDGVTWVEHYNLLVRAARGRYMMWMPHDDSFPADYVSQLVERLEARPDAVLAFGRLDPVDRDGVPLPSWFSPPPFADERAWTIRDSLRLLFWGPAVPFRGVFRRETVVRHDLAVPRTRDTIGADAYWVFALSLRGRLSFVPTCACAKRFHPGSASAGFRPTWRHVAEGTRVLRAALRARGGGWRDVAVGHAGVLLWGARWGITLPVRRLPAPAKLWIKRRVYGRPRGREA